MNKNKQLAAFPQKHRRKRWFKSTSLYEYDSPNIHHKFPQTHHWSHIHYTLLTQEQVNSLLQLLNFVISFFKTLLVIIHLLPRLIITLPFLSFSKNKWYALHNSKFTNILSIWLLERLSDKGKNIKAKTHWLPRWKGCLWNATAGTRVRLKESLTATVLNQQCHAATTALGPTLFLHVRLIL